MRKPEMTGRTRLTWVTALTVASLLIGGGALNAFADGQGGKNGGGGRGNVQHQQQQSHGISNDKDTADHGNHFGQGRAAAVVEAAHADFDEDNRGPGSLNRGRRDVDAAEDADEDLVAQPDRVTEDVRPGLGCGDRNHEHLRHDECPDKFLDDEEEDEDEG
jgi:hypothetical protein